MPAIKELIPDCGAFVALTSSELGGYILEVLTSGSARDAMGMYNLGNFAADVGRSYEWPRDGTQQRAMVAVSAAWTWLRVNGLICPDPGANPSFDWITPLGTSVRDRNGVRTLLSNQELPEHMLHAALLADARPLFLQRRFDTAVFEAFKSLEVAVRAAAGLGPDRIGTKLMSEAFHPDQGVLTDLTLEAGERVALQQLMVGSIGSYKNPSSHRKVELAADEAREMIILASHLLKITDARRALRQAKNG